MIILRESIEIKNWVESQRNSGQTIGFAPTMGALHQGHISLVNQSKQENDLTIVSIFVNPTQFNNLQDLKKYPRTEKKDAEMLEEAGVDVLFLPTVEEMYPQETESQPFDFEGLENQMEGKFRPGHFDGVATIVRKFFEIIQPNRAYFGEKDFQQLRIIEELALKIPFNIEIIPVEIMRELDGLAMSSRNVRLSEEMRLEAPKIYRILKNAKRYFEDNSIEATEKFVMEAFAQTKLKLEYFEIADEKTLISMTEKSKDKKPRAFVAAFADEIRLIDNLGLY
ncbi:pantoate--beta-alanine ligase [Moheibacter lacus]|uniref:Pantothenate synthetase n=1 Tax=Moheibacter lacus TaxID=2745851 RepID=A0A838ZML1_9FLAO|nr:pantoate--beta-alanine ligase [Moheibacter lacus]MBA5628836.1 pantoate--beta-alanine ligase [Moheibacter lacus]